MTNDEALAKIEERFPDLDVWKVRVASIFEPEAGSELAEDDLDWPPMRTSEMARCGLSSAVDHLDAFRLTIDARRLFPLSQLSVLRGAIIGAALAVWILAPDNRAERVSRSRTAAIEWHEQHRLYTRSLLVLPGADVEVGKEQIDFITARRDKLAAKRGAEGESAKFSTTSVIREASLATFQSESHADESVTEWRRTSGTAHGWSWPLMSHSGSTRTESGEAGMVWLGVGGDLTALVNPYLLAYWLTVKGWRLLLARAAVAPE